MSVWSRLGIPPGSDRREIRRAYARLVREVNPEDDPEGFKTLREAFEEALYQADSGFFFDDRDEPEPAEEPEGGWDAPIWPEALAPENEPPYSDADDGFRAAPDWPGLEPERRPELQDRLQAFASLLHEQAEPDRLCDAMEAILASSELEEIGAHRSVESWLAYHLAGAIPASDPLLERAVAYFAWNRNEIGADRDWNVATILRRIDEWQEIGWIAQREHPLNEGWLELTDIDRPAWQRRFRALRPEIVHQVSQLFALADYELPNLRHHFDPGLAGWWDEWLAKPRMTIDTWLAAPFVYAACLMLLRAGNGGAIEWHFWLLPLPFALAIPLAYFRVKARLDRWWQQSEKPPSRWFLEGWIAAALLVPFAAMALGDSLAAASASVLLAGLAALWTALAIAPSAPAGDLSARLGKVVLMLWGLALLTVFVPAQLEELQAIVWVAIASSFGFIWVRAHLHLAFLVSRYVREWVSLAGMATVAALIVAAWLLGGAFPDSRHFLGSVTLLAGWLVIQAFWLVHAEENKIHLVLAWVALVVLYLVWVPEQAPSTPQAEPPAITYTPAPAECMEVLPPGLDRSQPIPCGSPEAWRKPEHYPVRMVWPNAAATTSFRLKVDTLGRVTDCRVTSTSGSRDLDDATCWIMEEHGRFLPALDPGGRPVGSSWESSLSWKQGEARPPQPASPVVERTSYRPPAICPPDPPIAAERPRPVPCGNPGGWFGEEDYPLAALRLDETGTTAFRLEISPAGAVSSCEITETSGSTALDDATCRLLRERGRFLPARDVQGYNLESAFSSRVTWKLPE